MKLIKLFELLVFGKFSYLIVWTICLAFFVYVKQYQTSFWHLLFKSLEYDEYSSWNAFLNITSVFYVRIWWSKVCLVCLIIMWCENNKRNFVRKKSQIPILQMQSPLYFNHVLLGGYSWVFCCLIPNQMRVHILEHNFWCIFPDHGFMRGHIKV